MDFPSHFKNLGVTESDILVSPLLEINFKLISPERYFGNEAPNFLADEGFLSDLDSGIYSEDHYYGYFASICLTSPFPPPVICEFKQYPIKFDKKQFLADLDRLDKDPKFGKFFSRFGRVKIVTLYKRGV